MVRWRLQGVLQGVLLLLWPDTCDEHCGVCWGGPGRVGLPPRHTAKVLQQQQQRLVAE
jgi:hypothetical protein